MSCSEVAHVLGLPTDSKDTVVPIESSWGLQPAAAFKIRPGAPVREWRYRITDGYIFIWFAQVGSDGEDGWRVTMTASLPDALCERV